MRLFPFMRQGRRERPELLNKGNKKREIIRKKHTEKGGSKLEKGLQGQLGRAGNKESSFSFFYKAGGESGLPCRQSRAHKPVSVLTPSGGGGR